MAGVIPPIFASSILLFPGSIASWFGQGDGTVADVLQELSMAISPGQPLYVMLLAAAIIFLLFLLHGVGIQPA